MMKATLNVLILLGGLSHVTANSLSMCSEDTCGTCPDTLLVTAPTDGRTCVVYATSDIISNGGFPPVGSSGQQAWFTGTPDVGTAMSVRSPGDEGSELDCGVQVGAINKPLHCDSILLQDTFALTECSSDEECISRGISGGVYEPPTRKRQFRGTGNLLGTRDESSVQYRATALTRADGSLIRPLAVTMKGKDYMYEFLSLFNATDLLATPATNAKVRRVSPGGPGPSAVDPGMTHDPVADDSCTMFTADDPNGYIRADEVTYQMNGDLYGGPDGATISNSFEKTDSWSVSENAGLTFEVFSAGVSFTTEESTSRTISYTVNVPADTSGYAGWTPFYMCASGTVTCGSGSHPGEACSPYQDNGGNPAGETTFVQYYT